MQIGEVASFQNGYAFKSKDFVQNGKYKIIKIKELKDGKVRFFNDSASVNVDDERIIEKYIVEKGDVLFALTGDPVNKNNPLSWVGRVSVYEDDQLALLNQRVCKLVPKEGINAKYIYYYFRAFDNFYALASIAKGSASQANISTKDIEAMEIALPSLNIQNKIVSVLDSIEEKINQNNKINNNLEQQARSLFKSWFVDFDPFGNTMSADWKNGKLKDILKLKRQSIKAGENTTLPYLPIDVIPMRTFALIDFKPNAEAQSSLITFDKNDIIIGAMRVYFHRVVLAPCDGITRTTCFTLAPYNNEYLSFALLCCDQESSIDYAQSTSKGSTMPYAIWEGGLGDMEIIIPTPEIAKKFNEIVLPMLRQIQNSYFENKRLREIRDALLTRLMSGELDVSNIEI